jgi:hypothetical protein
MPAAPAFSGLPWTEQAMIAGTPCTEGRIEREPLIGEPVDDVLHEAINWSDGGPGSSMSDRSLKLRYHFLGFIDRNILDGAHAAARSADGQSYDCCAGRNSAQSVDMDMSGHANLL